MAEDQGNECSRNMDKEIARNIKYMTLYIQFLIDKGADRRLIKHAELVYEVKERIICYPAASSGVLIHPKTVNTFRPKGRGIQHEGIKFIKDRLIYNLPFCLC